LGSKEQERSSDGGRTDRNRRPAAQIRPKVDDHSSGGFAP
jgi:hypothetical protein